MTGAAQGIGQAISVAYAAAGADVAAVDLSAEACQRTLELASVHGVRCRAFGVDVTNEAAVHSLAAVVGAEIGDVSIVVNNAGVLIREGIDSPVVAQNMRRMMEVNYFGSFHVIHAWLPALRRTRGCIVNIASGAALFGHRGSVGYSGSKGALRLLTQSLAADLGKDGIRVNALAPGVIDTPMTEATRSDPRRVQGFLSRIPIQRLGAPDEVAGAAVFLASDLASYVNGVILPVDGGLHAC